ncbi:hypothetical protein K501DRAFT_248807 [Backusella circina FSU 941]|nr:hypothetical protein K501DRAFT_248807 [Backusella circina FSU 941]
MEAPATADGLSAILGPVVLQVDKAILATQNSQDDLGKEIERLVAELELFSEIAEPPKLQMSMEKLTDAKKRLVTANKLMQKTSERVLRIQEQLATMRQ